MKKILFFMARMAGFYGSDILKVFKYFIIVAAVVALLYFVLVLSSITIEIKNAGDVLWSIG